MYNEKIKKNIYTWRDSHKEEYNQYFRDVVYVKNAEKIKEKRMSKYYLEKELRIFREILL